MRNSLTQKFEIRWRIVKRGEKRALKGFFQANHFPKWTEKDKIRGTII